MSIREKRPRARFGCTLWGRLLLPPLVDMPLPLVHPLPRVLPVIPTAALLLPMQDLPLPDGVVQVRPQVPAMDPPPLDTAAMHNQVMDLRTIQVMDLRPSNGARRPTSMVARHTLSSLNRHRSREAVAFLADQVAALSLKSHLGWVLHCSLVVVD
jgi:hypothetical protein